MVACIFEMCHSHTFLEVLSKCYFTRIMEVPSKSTPLKFESIKVFAGSTLLEIRFIWPIFSTFQNIYFKNVLHKYCKRPDTTSYFTPLLHKFLAQVVCRRVLFVSTREHLFHVSIHKNDSAIPLAVLLNGQTSTIILSRKLRQKRFVNVYTLFQLKETGNGLCYALRTFVITCIVYPHCKTTHCIFLWWKWKIKGLKLLCE